MTFLFFFFFFFLQFQKRPLTSWIEIVENNYRLKRHPCEVTRGFRVGDEWEEAMRCYGQPRLFSLRGESTQSPSSILIPLRCPSRRHSRKNQHHLQTLAHSGRDQWRETEFNSLPFSTIRFFLSSAVTKIAPINKSVLFFIFYFYIF